MGVAVYGNLISDTVVTINVPLKSGQSHCCRISTRMGGIANFCRAGRGLFPQVAVTAVGRDDVGRWAVYEMEKICPTMASASPDKTTQAVVIADKSTNIRTGMVEWGACRSRKLWAPEVNHEWHHFMYLDRLSITNLEDFHKYGTVSADFCDSAEIENYRHLLPFVDWLIVSELEDGRSVRDLKLPVRKGVIVHSPEGSYVVGGQQFRAERQEGLNVVGAGDYFAAHCVANLRTDSLNLAVVHHQTVALLRNQS